MRTARLPTIRVSVAMPHDISPGGVGVGPQVNKFEQVISDWHQISLVWGPGARRGWGPMSHVRFALDAIHRN